MDTNLKFQKCLNILNEKKMVNVEFVEVGDSESLMDVAVRYAEENGLRTGEWTGHDTHGFVDLSTVIIRDQNLNVVKTLAHIEE